MSVTATVEQIHVKKIIDSTKHAQIKMTRAASPHILTPQIIWKNKLLIN